VTPEEYYAFTQWLRNSGMAEAVAWRTLTYNLAVARRALTEARRKAREAWRRLPRSGV
jgi:hypothetical protein